MLEKMIKSEAEWRKILTPEQYRITREKGTERARSGRYHDFNGTGVYLCVCCGSRLFSSREKYTEPAEWPAFWAPIAPRNVRTRRESSPPMARTEVVCSRCDAHLGYAFEDERSPAGVRYLVNSASLHFKENCLRAKRPEVVLDHSLPLSPAYAGAF